MESKNNNFTGIWIPNEVVNLTNIGTTQKFILSMIIALNQTDEGCYASNEYFSDKIQLTKGRVSEIITELHRKELVSYEVNQRAKHIRILRPQLAIKENPVNPTEKTLQPVREKPICSTGKTLQPVREKPIHNKKVYTEAYKEDDREILPLDFLNFNYLKEFEEWVTKKGNKIYLIEDFKEGFNNKVRLKKYKLDKDLLMILEDYSRWWITNQKEDQKPHNFIPWRDFDKLVTNKNKNALYYLEKKYPLKFKSFNKEGKPKIKDFEKFEIDFNKICFDEQIDFSENNLWDRLKTFFLEWIAEDKKDNPIGA